MGLRLNLGYTVCPRRCRDGTSTVRIGPGNGHLLVLVLGRSIFGGCAVDAGSWRLGAGELSGLSCPSKSPVPQGPKRNIENTIQPVESSPSSPPRTGFLLGQCRQGNSDSKLTPQHDTRPHQSGLVCRLQHLDTLTGVPGTSIQCCAACGFKAALVIHLDSDAILYQIGDAITTPSPSCEETGANL